jgi:hypothetical protein
LTCREPSATIVLMDKLMEAISDELLKKGYNSDRLRGTDGDYVDVRNAPQSLQVDIRQYADSLLLSVYELDFEGGGINYHHLREHDIELADPDSPDLIVQIIAYLDKHIGLPGS